MGGFDMMPYVYLRSTYLTTEGFVQVPKTDSTEWDMELSYFFQRAS